uniref:Uncharacterized protein n=1 Tax=Cucumis sativus TaxID=3659 RepID=A0A0A0L3A6_CUCSA
MATNTINIWKSLLIHRRPGNVICTNTSSKGAKENLQCVEFAIPTQNVNYITNIDDLVRIVTQYTSESSNIVSPLLEFFHSLGLNWIIVQKKGIRLLSDSDQSSFSDPAADSRYSRRSLNFPSHLTSNG